MRRRATKEKILDAALSLFSEKGYDGVGIDEIAQAAGIKGPSIYRHFKSKSDLYDALIEKVEEYYDAHMPLSDSESLDLASLTELKELTLKQVDFTMHDPVIVKVRKLLTKEQFRSFKTGILATKHFQSGIETLYSAIFSRLMKRGIIRSDNPELLAMEYVSPITMLIHLSDREPSRRHEIMNRIREHITHFEKIYGE